MIGITKMISLTVILCLCIVPLDIQPAPAPVPVGAPLVVEVIDEMTHTRIPDATVAVWYDNTKYFVGYCVKTDNDLLATEWAFYCDDELVLIAWHEDYYLGSIEYTVPSDAPYEDKGYFMASIELFRKSMNMTAGMDEFPIDVPFDTETNLMISVTLSKEDTVFGMPYDWIDFDTGDEYSKGVIILSSDRILVMPHTYEWQTVNRFYYAFEIGGLYGGNSVIQIPVILFQNCEIGISIVDTVKLEKIYTSYELDGDTFIYVSDVTLSYRHYISTFSYVNETLNCVGDMQVEYGYQPTYVYPAGYIPLEDLCIVWEIPDNNGRRSWWLDIDLGVYAIIICVAGIISFIYIVHRKYLVCNKRKQITKRELKDDQRTKI